jgi:hypothetical protein
VLAGARSSLTGALCLTFIVAAGAAPGASAAAPPCDPGRTTAVTLTPMDGYTRSATRLVASHPIDLDVEFAQDVGNVRVTASGASVKSSGGRSWTVTAPRAGPVVVRVDWEQTFFEGDIERTCSGSASRTLAFVAGKPLRVASSRDMTRGFRQELSLDLLASGASDLSRVKVRWRARRGAARFPSGRFVEGTIDPLDQRSRDRFSLGRSGGLRGTGEVFSFAGRSGERNDVGRVTIARFGRYSTGTFKGGGGLEIQLWQSGRRLLRVRAKLSRCHGIAGCRVAASIQASSPILFR